MAFTAPGVEDFYDRYPEFAGVEDYRIDALLREAAAEVGSGWIESDRHLAMMAYAAHVLATELASAAVSSLPSAGSEGSATSRPIIRKTVGPLSLQYEKSSASSNSSSGSVAATVGFESTAYGVRFLQLMRRSFPPVLVL
jgi:hypothetical protein